MRIAYITPYQGPTLVKRRPIIRNRSMSNRIKIELIASLLRKANDVELFSQGEVVDHALTFYPWFTEPERFHPDIPVYYSSILPIRRLNGLWSNASTLRLFKQRHQAKPFDLVIVFNMKGPEIACANYALGLGIPVIVEYEDDVFVDVLGTQVDDFSSRRSRRAAAELLARASGCIGVSPHLLTQVPAETPKLLLRGVVGNDIVAGGEARRGGKENIVMFSGTHTFSNGVEELIQAWREVNLPDWKLHITGFGKLTDSLRKMAEDVPGVVFHGLVSREQLVELMTSTKICINPHTLSQTPGNVFAFKIIEYLAAGAHVVTTPMGALEKEVEAGITYIPNNEPKTIVKSLRTLVDREDWKREARRFVIATYGEAATAEKLAALIASVTHQKTENEPELAGVR
jgi:glycosyltransferase involved in cell wall biosynthesis